MAPKSILKLNLQNSSLNTESTREDKNKMDAECYDGKVDLKRFLTADSSVKCYQL